MMLYLAGSTRPDIAYVVYQCAQVSHAPTCSRDIGVKHIVQYLKGRRTKEIIMNPDLKNIQLDLFSNADFAGLYSTEEKLNSISVNS